MIISVILLNLLAIIFIILGMVSIDKIRESRIDYYKNYKRGLSFLSASLGILISAILYNIFSKYIP